MVAIEVVRLATAMRLRIAVALELVAGQTWATIMIQPDEIVGPTALAARPTLNVSGALPQRPVICPSTLARDDRPFLLRPTRNPVLRISTSAILVKAPCIPRGRVPEWPARLCAVRWAGTVVMDRQRRAAATAVGTPGLAQPVCRQQQDGVRAPRQAV